MSQPTLIKELYRNKKEVVKDILSLAFNGRRSLRNKPSLYVDGVKFVAKRIVLYDSLGNYYCPFCGETGFTRRGIRNHILRRHVDEVFNMLIEWIEDKIKWGFLVAGHR